MATKRVAGGRLDRVGQRRRSRHWRIILGVGATVGVVVVVIFALYYKGRLTKKKHGGAAPPTPAAPQRLPRPAASDGRVPEAVVAQDRLRDQLAALRVADRRARDEAQEARAAAARERAAARQAGRGGEVVP